MGSGGIGALKGNDTEDMEMGNDRIGVIKGSDMEMGNVRTGTLMGCDREWVSMVVCCTVCLFFFWYL